MSSAKAELSRPAFIGSRRQPEKRKREDDLSRSNSNKASRTGTPNAYARRSPPRNPEPAPISEADDDESRERSPPRTLKRPGQGARATANRQAAEAARKKREEEARAAVVSRATASDLVASHYNAVPERGREWRKTDSQIKGLRSLNNWIKSTLIQKFSQPEVPPQHGMTVLDMACGKGGDLGKWEKAPMLPALYVGCDIADVSIDQAKQRYAESQRKNQGRRGRPLMQAEFYVKDTFGTSMGEIPIIRQVGFNPNAGPGPNIIGGSMMSGGFDVVSMMFALHYSFESEQLARGMLKNVAGSLKKGGKFIGVMPDSNVITSHVKRLLQGETDTDGRTGTPGSKRSSQNGVANGQTSAQRSVDGVDDWDPERLSEPVGEVGDEDDWDPEKPSEPVNEIAAPEGDGDGNDWDPEKPSEPVPAELVGDPLATIDVGNATSQKQQDADNGTPSASLVADINAPPIEWGNSIYKVRFQRHQPLTKRPLPKDGIFRPAFGWKYHYSLEEAVNVPEYVVPWAAFRALAEDYGLELMYRKGFREVFEDESTDHELGMLAERMGVMSRNRSEGRNGLLVSDEEMEAAAFYHAFCFYKT